MSYVDVHEEIERAKLLNDLTEGTSLQTKESTGCTPERRLTASQSRSLLSSLLRSKFPHLNDDDIARRTGLECGVIKGTSIFVWASSDEFARYPDKFELCEPERPNLDNFISHVQRIRLMLMVRQVCKLSAKKTHRILVEWKLQDDAGKIFNSGEMPQVGKKVELKWHDVVQPLYDGSFEQCQELKLVFIIRYRSRLLPWKNEWVVSCAVDEVSVLPNYGFYVMVQKNDW